MAAASQWVDSSASAFSKTGIWSIFEDFNAWGVSHGWQDLIPLSKVMDESCSITANENDM